MANDTTDSPPDENPLFLAVGKAISEYAQVEFTLASILRHLLKIDFLQAHEIFFTIQNVRARNELYETLLRQQFGPDIKKHWDSCSLYLQRLALFRNALAHWHQSGRITLGKTDADSLSECVISHPVPGSGMPSIAVKDIELFMADCRAIRTDLTSIVFIAKEQPDTLPERFLQPITHRNRADLLRPRKPKAQQHPPRSSQAKVRKLKPSAKQRRLHAIARTKRARRTMPNP